MNQVEASQDDETSSLEAGSSITGKSSLDCFVCTQEQLEFAVHASSQESYV